MKDININLLRHHQREQLQSEIKQADEMLVMAKPEDKGVILANRDRTRRQLEAGSPVPLTGAEKDKLSVLEKKLLTRITTNMPTQEVMRKNPAGGVDWHMKWEKHNKKIVRMWKNIKIQLNPDNSDKDLTNIERFRPAGQTDRMRTDAQIVGLMSYGNVPDENWPFDEPQNTALKQVQRHYEPEQGEADVNAAIEEFDREVGSDAEVEPETMAPEKKVQLLANLAKGREVLKAKREADKQLSEALETSPKLLEENVI